MSAVMSDDGLLSAEALQSITGKTRPHAQAAWFQRQFAVSLPYNTERAIISRTLFEQLQAKRAGLLSQAAPAEPERPRLYSVKKPA